MKSPLASSTVQGQMKLRVKVAELGGWAYPLDRSKNKPMFEMNEPGMLRYERHAKEIPDYPNDLNACADMRRELPRSKKEEFIVRLYCLVTKQDFAAIRHDRSLKMSPWMLWFVMDASAAAQCLVFVKTMEARK